MYVIVSFVLIDLALFSSLLYVQRTRIIGRLGIIIFFVGLYLILMNFIPSEAMHKKIDHINGIKVS